VRLLLFCLVYLTLFSSAVHAQSTPLEDCFTYTYKFRIGAASNSIAGGKSFIDKSGSSYFIGTDLSNPGQSAGIIHKNDYTQSPTWTFAFSIPGKSLSLEQMDQLPNGDLVVIGTASDPGGSNAQIYIARLVNNGLLVWSRLLPITGFLGKTISVSATGSLVFAGQTPNDALIYGSMLPDGNLQWLKRSTAHSDLRIAGLIAKTEHRFTLAFTETLLGRQVGKLLLFDPVTGQLDALLIMGGGIPNEDYILHDIEEGNNRTHVSGIYRSGNNAYQFFDMRLTKGLIEEFKLYDLPGRTVTADAKSDITYYGAMLSFLPEGNSSEVLLLKTEINTSQPQNIRWAKKWALTQPANTISTHVAFDGGYLITTAHSNPAPGTGIHAIKTDSTGTVKNCEGTNFPVTASVRYLIDLPSQSHTIEDLSIVPASANGVSNPGTLTTQFDCKSLACEPRPVEPSCVSTFARNYRSPVFMDVAKSIIMDGSTDFMIFGSTTKFQSINLIDFIASFNASGKIKDRRQFQVGNISVINKAIRAKNGDLVIVGQVIDGSDRYIGITRMSSDYSLIWNRSYQYQVSGLLFMADLIEDDEGSFFLSYSQSTPLCTEQRILKLNSDGSLNWLRVYYDGYKCINGLQGSMTQDADYLYLATEGASSAVVFKVRKTTGELIWNKEIAGPDGYYSAICNNISIVNDRLVLNGAIHSPGGGGMLVLQLDKDGNVLLTKQVPNITSGAMMVTYNSDIVFVGSTWDGSGYFIRMDDELNLLNSKRVVANGYSYGSELIEAPDGGILGIGNNSYGLFFVGDFTVFKFNPDGSSANCPTDTLVLPAASPGISMVNTNGTYNPGTLTSRFFPIAFYPYALQENKSFCVSPSTCQDFALIGPAAICDNQLYTITARRNPTCNALVYFSLPDNSVAEIQAFTDSTVSIRFNQSGTTTLTGRMFNGCDWIEHTLELKASLSNVVLDLGADTSICAGASFEITAGNEYSSYRWNTGSEEAAITVSGAGKFYVDVLDGCGNTKSDTIYVSERIPDPLSIGIDRDICTGDTIWLKAPAGFTNLVWSRENLVLPDNGNEFISRPQSTGNYQLEAIGPGGCSSFDRVLVTVRERLPLELDPVLPFCEGDSLEVSAPGGFVSYEWSTGAGSQTIFIKSAGTYSIRATASNSCSSSDTIEIDRLYALPVVHLPELSGICENSILQLDAGVHASVEWQDGSTGRFYAVREPGRYFVTAVSNEGCTSSDTLIISRQFENPKQFLPEDTTVCRYGSVNLSSNSGFTTYLWNTGVGGRQITANRAGTYWLEVTDQNGCKGRDTILITEIQCQKEGIYFPNVFSPNGDGKNDRYKPVTVGNFIQYRFSIYNRFGQLIFTTDSIQEGWDGSLQGYPQNPGNFVWSCVYQLEGGTVQKVRGNLLLMR
jgi:gliding motility-associated-like protein